MISYEPFWKTIADRQISTYALINRHGILPDTIQRLRSGRPITTTTLNTAVSGYHCEISVLWNLYRNRTVRQIQLNNYCLHPLFHFNSFYGAPCGIVFFTVGCFISTDAYIVFFFLSQILKGYLCGFSFDCQRLCIFHFLGRVLDSYPLIRFLRYSRRLSFFLWLRISG